MVRQRSCYFWRSEGPIWVLATLVFCCLTVAPSAEQANGSVEITIKTKLSDGRTFIDPGESVWVYARNLEGGPGRPWSLINWIDLKPGRGPMHDGFLPFYRTVPAGRYEFNLVKANNSVAAPLVVSEEGCNPVANVSAGATTKLQFPNGCMSDSYPWPSGWGARAAHAFGNDYWLQLADDMEKAFKECVQIRAPLVQIYQHLITSHPQKAVVLIKKLDWREPNEFNYFDDREFNAAQIRLIVKSFEYFCLADNDPGKWPVPKTEEESMLAYQLRERANAEVRAVRALYKIADVLDSMVRDQKAECTRHPGYPCPLTGSGE